MDTDLKDGILYSSEVLHPEGLIEYRLKNAFLYYRSGFMGQKCECPKETGLKDDFLNCFGKYEGPIHVRLKNVFPQGKSKI